MKENQKYIGYASWPVLIINTHQNSVAQKPLSGTYFHGSKGIQAIEVLLYVWDSEH